MYLPNETLQEDSLCVNMLVNSLTTKLPRNERNSMKAKQSLDVICITLASGTKSFGEYFEDSVL